MEARGRFIFCSNDPPVIYNAIRHHYGTMEADPGMKLCIIGLPQAGKDTVFAALTGARGEKDGQSGSRSDTRIGTVTVFDERIDFLSRMYQPKKTIHARIEYFLPAEIRSSPGSRSDGGFLTQARVCDALVHVVRNFENPAAAPPNPEGDFFKLEEEMILNDLVVVEKRMERLTLDMKRGKKPDEREMSLLTSCKEILESGRSLRTDPGLADDPLLKGFTFLSGKPELVLVNNDDEDETLPGLEKKPEVEWLVVRGRLEMDIASMTGEEAKEFIEAYHIKESALDRVIGSSYRILNRISFFTVGPDEVRAWPITAGTPAMEAAGEVHSDISKGFIRAEVVAYEDLKSLGGFQEAKKAGLVRLEGKEYVVKDGDIINFRFNV